MTGYDEKLTPSPAAWLLVLPAATFAGALLAPFGALLAVVAALVVGGATAAALSRSAARIQVTGSELWVGPAHVPLDLVGRVDVLDAEQARHGLGPGLDARAFVCTRPWVRTAVRVELLDPADPTPYWFVATRRPGELAAALRRGGG